MKKYFTMHSRSTQPKNKLQQEIWTMFDDRSNRVIDDLELAIVEIRNQITGLNEVHSRCQEMTVTESRNNENCIKLFAHIRNSGQGAGAELSFHLIKD